MTDPVALALQQSEARYRQLFESHPHPMWVYDLTSLRFLAVNHAAIAHYGYSRVEFLEMTIKDIRPSEDVPALLENVASAHADFEESGLWRHRLKDGRIIFVEISSHSLDFAGRPAKVVWAHDITERKRSEAEVLRLVRRLETTLESITDAFLTLDRQWRFTYLNGEAERLVQRTRDDLLGKVVWEEFKEAVGSTFDREYRRALAENRTVEFEEFYPPLGRWFEVRAYPSEEGLAVYFRDVSERRELEAKLHQSQRLEAIGQLTGGVAHDFNNLLTVILGNAELLAAALSQKESLRTLAEMIRSAAERGADLTHHLLAFARQQALEPRVFDLNELLSRMDGLLRRTLGEHVEITMAPSVAPWKALVDDAQLEGAILNLCINARDAMPGGGRIAIETANAQLDQSYADWNDEVAPGQYVMIAISDTGTGMPPEVVARVFEPFFTTKEVGKGTGLGLSMVYGFMKQSGGHVRIYSELNHGTTVKLYLPRAPEGAAEFRAPAAEAQAPTGAERILLVEDDDLVRRHVSAQLSDLGYQVVSVSNGPEAIEAAKGEGEFHLLFTDVIMPGGLNGPQVAAEIRKLRPNLPVLYTSGYTENMIVHHGRLDPGVHLLNKPYRRSELAIKVRVALGSVVSPSD